MPGLDWLTERPVAHRGLHDAMRGIVENTASAFSAAMGHRYAIECDLQVSGDGEAMVFHDATLERLTEQQGVLAALPAKALRSIAFKTTADRMMTLGELCDLVAGRVALVLELKSPVRGDARLAGRVADVLQGYAGPVAAMSFDPELVSALRAHAPGLPRGLVAERDLLAESSQPNRWAYLRTTLEARPHFLAWSVRDLPALWPSIGRHALGLPLLTWTVRTNADRERATRHADQMIFEGFRP